MNTELKITFLAQQIYFEHKKIIITKPKHVKKKIKNKRSKRKTEINLICTLVFKKDLLNFIIRHGTYN